MKFFSTIFLSVIFFSLSMAQQNDSVSPQQHRDSNIKPQPTIQANEPDSPPATMIIRDTNKQKDSLLGIMNIKAQRKDSTIGEAKKTISNYDSILSVVGLPIFATPKMMLVGERNEDRKDFLFYTLVSIVFLFALVKVAFSNYIQNTISLFLQTTGINANAKYMAQQNGIAFVLMQLVFVLSGGVYVTLVSMKYFHFQYPFWQTLLASSLFLAIVYIGKYISVKTLGWVFDKKGEAKIYILFLFMVNRVAVMVLVPVILILAFSNESITYFAFVFSVFLLIALFIYRYFLIIKTIQPQLRAKTIQIFLYLCTVEILPVALLYKFIINYTAGMS